jgi:hypothetical protein
MPDNDYDLYVGVDWATEAHQVCLLSSDGTPLGELSVPHTGAGLAALRAELQRRVSDPARIAVAIEVPHGAVVDALLDHGCHVFAINPKQLDRFRDRHTVAGAKDDRRDAFVGADALRTDRRAFRRLQAEDPRVLHLRELSRLHGELVEEQGRLTNRLREQLWRFYPQLLTLSPAADEPWLWALLEQAPTPAQGRRLPVSAVRVLLARHRIRRLTADTPCRRPCRSPRSPRPRARWTPPVSTSACSCRAWPSSTSNALGAHVGSRCCWSGWPHRRRGTTQMSIVT